MSESVPNLRPHFVRPDADGAQCAGHCDHVGFMWRDFKRMEKAFWVLFVGIVGLIIKDVALAERSHPRPAPIPSYPNERLGNDRIPEPPTP